MDKVVKSAGRVLEIFEFFAHRHAPATVSEVSEALNFPLSSTSVLLKSLLTLGYLEYRPRSREYQPTIRFAVLGTWIFDRLFSDEESIPRLMDELQAETEETIVLAMQHGLYVDYIRILQSIAPVRFYIKPGARRPIWLPAAGKVLLAQHPDAEVTALLRRVNANEPASGRVPVKAFLAELAAIRRNGYAVSEAAIVPDTAMIAMAVPVPGGHRPLALAVSGPLERMRRNRTQILALMQRKLAGAVSARAGSGSVG
jgi:DNA-binding IclR family transcriptional regulator